MVDCRNIPVEDLIKSQLQSEEEFTDQRSSHFKLCISVNSRSLQKKSAPSFDMLFGTVMTKLKLFHVIERKMYHARQTCEFDEKFDIYLTKILLPKRLVIRYSLILKLMHYQILFTELKWSY